MAEVMSEAARKSVIAMIVEKLWPMALVWCDMRSLTGRKNPLVTGEGSTTAQSVRNHQCPPVCRHRQLTTSAHSTLARTGGRGTRAFVFHQVVLLTRSEVKLGLTDCIPEQTVAWKLLSVNKAA